MGKSRLFSAIFMLAASIGCTAQSPEQKIWDFIAPYDAEIGVAAICGNDTITVGRTEPCPMASVVKFPQAVAALDCMEKNNIPMDSLIEISKEDLHENTYSPMRNHFPNGTKMPISELIYYSMALSDNNACDKIFTSIISPSETDCYIKSIGITGMNISMTENEMHADVANSYKNSATPLSVALLTEKLLKGEILTSRHRDFLAGIMEKCQTGANLLKTPLRNGDTIGHKTGTGDRNATGRYIATNDAGFIKPANGKAYSIAVFVMDSAETPSTNAEIIAGISRIIYDSFK